MTFYRTIWTSVHRSCTIKQPSPTSVEHDHLIGLALKDDDQICLIDKQLQRQNANVLVVFVDHTECQWLKWLKPGFRHCFAAIRDGKQWIICDSLKNKMELLAVDAPADFDLAEFYASYGHTVLLGSKSWSKPSNYPSAEFLTCVAVTKRLLGLRSFWIWTPWQLFSFLTNHRTHSTSWWLVSTTQRVQPKFKLDISP